MTDDIYSLYNIDKNKLKRDYIKDPLKWIIKKSGGYTRERPNKDDLYYLYITLNVELKDILLYFNVTTSLFYKFLNEYNIKKTTKNRRDNNEKCLMRLFGVKNQFQRQEIKKLCNTKEIMLKKYKTMCKNNSFNTSSSESYIFKKLSNVFNEIKTQYKSKKYPYKCDFYIPEIDTYIEYNGHWSHGFEPYIGTKEQLNKINQWKLKSKEINIFGKNKDEYINAIDVWTRRDVEKRKIAKENNLNYIVFYNLSQFSVWFKSINN